jgi:hypothetical protein
VSCGVSLDETNTSSNPDSFLVNSESLNIFYKPRIAHPVVEGVN